MKHNLINFLLYILLDLLDGLRLLNETSIYSFTKDRLVDLNTILEKLFERIKLDEKKLANCSNLNVANLLIENNSPPGMTKSEFKNLDLNLTNYDQNQGQINNEDGDLHVFNKTFGK